MKGHTLPGPSQKPSIGKNLQDYVIRDGKKVPISTEEFDTLMDEKFSTGASGFTQVPDIASFPASDFDEGELVSDKTTGVNRLKSLDNKYKTNKYGGRFEPNQPMEEPDFKGDEQQIADYDARQAELKGILKDESYDMKPSREHNMNVAVTRDLQDQQKVNEAYAKRMKEGGNQSIAQKKMKFGRKKK